MRRHGVGEHPGEDADFYVKVWMNGVKLPNPPSDADTPSSPRIDDNASVDPFWTISGMIPADLTKVPIAIQVWDHDGSSGDDLADISPAVNDNNLDFVFDRSNGTWFGADDGIVSPRNCSSGGGGGGNDQPRAKMCFDVGGDRDGDGLLDTWERSGYDDDGDGTVDVDLPGMGADPDHKDLFLEIDYDGTVLPTREAIDEMRAAFSAAPMNAGSRAGEREGANGQNDDTFGVSAPPNPDGLPGITLHVDTGSLVDSNAVEGAPVGTCTDGIDNGGDGKRDGADGNCLFPDASVEDSRDCGNSKDDDGDGLADGNDPDCLVGDPEFAGPLGHGQQITTPGACGTDDKFYAAKNSPSGQSTARRYIFRYSITAGLPNSCTDKTGGQGEIGGNDFVVFNSGQAVGGTIMHELGHTLNLRHGGFTSDNCKPNYLSIMNYDLQSGIPREQGGQILDYSPPRVALDGTTRGRAVLDDLQEDELDENVVLDGTDTENKFVFVNGNGDKIQTNLDAKPNWNGDVDNQPGQGYEDDVEVNVDTFGKNGKPGACKNSDIDDLPGAEDWVFVSLSFHGFGDASNAALGPETDIVPTTDDLASMRQEVNTTDLSVSQTDSPDPVAAGTDLTYTVRVRNNGLNPATSVEVKDTLPADLAFSSSSVSCVHNSALLTCNLGTIEPTASRSFTITVHVPADLVYNNGGPKTVTNAATVQNLAGPDPMPADNSASQETQVIGVADVQITGATATSPLEVLIGETSTVALAVTTQNGGPSSPVDAVLTTSATADPGVQVSPSSSTMNQTALVVGSSRVANTQLSLSCSAPGQKTVTLTSRVALKNAVDVDPDLTNNSRTTVFAIDCVVPIIVNVGPGGFPNSINLNTDATLAALTTVAGEYGLPLAVDATRIDVSKTLWGQRSNLFNVALPTGAPEIHGKIHPTRSYELDEQTRDADLDAVMHFKPSESGLTLSSTEACLKGKYTAQDGNRLTFLGCDSVRMVN